MSDNPSGVVSSDWADEKAREWLNDWTRPGSSTLVGEVSSLAALLREVEERNPADDPEE
jgi:hypothetical protein